MITSTLLCCSCTCGTSSHTLSFDLLLNSSNCWASFHLCQYSRCKWKMRCLKHFAATSAATRSLAEQLISSPVNTTARALLRLNTHTHTNGYALAHGETDKLVSTIQTLCATQMCQQQQPN